MNLKPITAIVLGFLCATSVFSVSLWCVFARNSSILEMCNVAVGGACATLHAGFC